MNGFLVSKDLPHVAEKAPILMTTRIPQDNVDVLRERIVGMLSHIQVNKIAEMMVHINTSV